MIVSTKGFADRIITSVDLAGEWPVIQFDDGTVREWGENIYLLPGEWESVEERTRRSVLRFLKAKGRMVQKSRAYIDSPEHVVHVPVHAPIPIIGTENRGFYVRLHAPSCRFEDNITIHVDNCYSEEEAQWMARQFLEDFITCGLAKAA